MLTMIYWRQVDWFRLDRAQWGLHFQPQLVAVHPQRLDGAGFLPGVDLQARRPHLPQGLTCLFPLLHHVTWQVSPPEKQKRTYGKKIDAAFSPLIHIFF